VPISSWPIDQESFSHITFVLCEPRVDRESGVQFTNKDGTLRKWNVQAVFSRPSRFDPARTESEVKDVSVLAAEDPSRELAGEIRFIDLTAGAMAPEKDENDRIRGGRIFLQANGAAPARVAVKEPSGSAERR
jgi:hypothetical protein